MVNLVEIEEWLESDGREFRAEHFGGWDWEDELRTFVIKLKRHGATEVYVNADDYSVDEIYIQADDKVDLMFTVIIAKERPDECSVEHIPEYGDYLLRLWWD
jgi:hypothetical protein